MLTIHSLSHPYTRTTRTIHTRYAECARVYMPRSHTFNIILLYFIIVLLVVVVVAAASAAAAAVICVIIVNRSSVLLLIISRYFRNLPINCLLLAIRHSNWSCARNECNGKLLKFSTASHTISRHQSNQKWYTQIYTETRTECVNWLRAHDNLLSILLLFLSSSTASMCVCVGGCYESLMEHQMNKVPLAPCCLSDHIWKLIHIPLVFGELPSMMKRVWPYTSVWWRI